jgi:hypothetical protein
MRCPIRAVPAAVHRIEYEPVQKCLCERRFVDGHPVERITPKETLSVREEDKRQLPSGNLQVERREARVLDMASGLMLTFYVRIRRNWS